MISSNLKATWIYLLQIHNLEKCSPEELIELAETSLTSISQHLGENPFFMGEFPSEIDATMFGFLGILLNGMESSASGQFVVKNLPNLVSYVERMKEKYWQDWDEQCSQPANKRKSKIFNIKTSKR